MNVSAVAASQQHSGSPKKSYGVLRSIMPIKDSNRRSDGLRTTTNESDHKHNHTTQSVPLLPPDHPHAASTNTTHDARAGRPSSRSKENTPPEKHKRSKSTVSLRSLGKCKDGDDKKEKKSRKERSGQAEGDDSRRKPKKTKSTTSLRGLFTRNRSSKDLSHLKVQVDKENLTPSPSTPQAVDTPIWSQFATAHAAPVADVSKTQVEAEIAKYTPQDYSPSKQADFSAQHGAPTLQRPHSSSRPTSSGRPKSALLSGPTSFMEAVTGKLNGEGPPPRGADGPRPNSKGREGQRPRPISRSKEGQRASMDQSRPWVQPATDRNVSSSSNEQAPPQQNLNIAKRGARVMAAVAVWNGKAKETEPAREDSCLDPKSVDAAFEAVLESRNIPENMRQKMRTLTLRVKADFVKQDRGASVPSSPVKSNSRYTLQSGQEIEHSTAQNLDAESQQPEDPMSPDAKKSRARSKTFTFTKSDSSPSKKQKSNARPTSIHIPKGSFSSTSPMPSPRTPSSSSARGPQSADPEEFVDYLKNVRDPTQVEVGRLHKLRLLLRNETVAWVDYFMTLGGMTEVVDLLHRIMAVEWREEHEDQLLHETLLCLKGLCTTEVALTKLEDMADTLFAGLLALLFDEEKKGPSEFNTRAIIINILFAYLSAAADRSPSAVAQRARSVLAYLAGPKKPEEAQPVSFVLEMQQPRPYRVWCNEVNNVTREVFWIFLHHLNVIPLPKAEGDPSSPIETRQPQPGPQDTNKTSSLAQPYTKRHFPGDRPPVPAAPYIGGVEWDATTYITAHLDLLNGLIASLPTKEERNNLRGELKASGWEKVMGGTLRTCKEKFYCGVHSGLQGWIAAAQEDGWNIEYVRYGPTQEELAAMSPKKSPKKAEAPPKLEAPVLDIPKLSIGLGGPLAEHESMDNKNGDDGWLL